MEASKPRIDNSATNKIIIMLRISPRPFQDRASIFHRHERNPLLGFIESQKHYGR